MAVFLIFNPTAGKLRGRRSARVVRAVAALEAQGLRVQAVPTPGPGTAGALAREAVEAGAERVLALGGDGTLNEVASGMIGSHVPLGVLPAGTANVLGREIGLGGNLFNAIRRLPECVPRRVPTGLLEAEGKPPRHFLLMAGIGFDAHIVYRLNLPLKARFGQIAYWTSAASEIGRRLDEFEVFTGGRAYRCSFALASRVRNYAGYLEIASGARLLGDDFELVLFEGRSTLRYYFKYLAAVAARATSNLKGMTFLRAREICFSAPAGSPVYVQVDGEFAGRLPARISIVPDALTLLVPPEFC
jgi:diacylglycerol kinase family enzyme